MEATLSVSRQIDIPVALGLFPSQRPIPKVATWLYRAKVRGPLPKNLYSFGARTARKLRKANHIPVVSRKLDLLALDVLTALDVSEEAEIIEIGPATLDSSRDGAVIERLVDEILAASVPRDRYLLGFNYAVEVRPHLRNAAGSIELFRGFRVQPKVFEEGTVALAVDLKHTITSRETVADLLDRGEEIDGLHVAHTYDGNTGVVVSLSGAAIGEPIEDLGNKTLVEYHREEGHLPQGFDLVETAPSALVRYDDRVYPHIPALLRPVMSLDAVKEEDPAFGRIVSQETHRGIRDRFDLCGRFVGSLRPLRGLGLTFAPRPAMAVALGYAGGLVTGNNLVFRNGYTAAFPSKGLREAGLYRAPDRIRAGLLHPEGQEERARLFWESLDALMETAFRISMVPGPRKAYRLGDTLGFKDAAGHFRSDDVDIVLAVVSPPRVTRGEDDPDDPYNPFKRTFARAGIPSQMVATRNLQDPDILLNLALGVVVKCGGLPWRIKEFPGRPECFIGLDISHKDGVHMAASAHLFDADGAYIGWNCVTAQKGETIAERDLLNAVEDVLLAFKEKHGRLPRSLVMHRDGRFTEERGGLVAMFKDHGIRFDLVEVKKTGAPRMGIAREGTYYSPNKGTYVVRGDAAQLCTTGEREYRVGTPRPITIRRVLGETDVAILTEQSYWLSEMHVGSTHSTRLPITTHYADKCSTLAQYGLLPTGRIESRLYFV